MRHVSRVSGWGRGVAAVLGGVLCTFSPVEAVTYVLKPLNASGSHTIVGNEIILFGANQTVEFAMRISNWDPDLNGVPLLAGYQGAIDSTGYSSGSGTPLAPLTTPNVAAGAYIYTSRCTVGQQQNPNGAPCGPGFPACPGGEFCIPDPDYIFANLQPIVILSTFSLNYEYGGVCQAQACKVDNGIDYYGGTLKVVVPAGAKGTYTIGWVNDVNFSFALDQNGLLITPLVLTPGKITIACTTGADCNDGNACTSDICNPNNTCSNPPNYNVATQCCNPANGATQTIADSNQCTDDICNPATGQVTHPPFPSGTACGSSSSTACDMPDTCNGAGVCLPNFAPSGTACGNPNNTDCDFADTCNGSGTCLTNVQPSGTPCGSPAMTDCTNPDTCNGLGTCLPNNVPNGTICNDGQFCTTGETCTNGVCGGGTVTNCNDGLPCTTDACNPGNGMCESVLDPGFCLISGLCVAHGSLNPSNTCFVCDTTQSTSQYSQLPEGSMCDDGNPCTGTGAPGVGDDTCDAGGVCMGDVDPDCNDTCENAVDVFEGVNAGFSNTAGGPMDDAEASCQPDSNQDIWFVYTASCTGPVLVTTTGSLMAPSNDSVLSVYDACGGMELACDDDSGPGLLSALTFDATVGNPYYIRVAGFSNNAGSVTVTISTVTGCLIDGVCYGEDDINPENECQICLPDVSTSSWTPRLVGTPCGDPADTECSSPDACDGLGVCEANHKPDGLLCTDDGNECTFDRCQTGSCAHPPRPSGTACGDPTNTECDNPDTCDGLGLCLDNLEPFGFPCGDPSSNQCDNPDICDGAANCTPNYVASGTPCNDGELCTGNDVCDQGICEGVLIPSAPTALTQGPKAFEVTPNPPAAITPVALKVTSPTYPCLLRYIQPDGTLGVNPVFQLPAAWGTVVVNGALVVPSATYVIEEECDSFVSPPASVDTCMWGDINCNKIVNVADIQLVTLAFNAIYSGFPFERFDITPCTPNGIINVADIQRVVLVQTIGQTYASICPVPCP